MNSFRLFLIFLSSAFKGALSVLGGGIEIQIRRVRLPVEAGQFYDWRMIGRDVIVGVRKCESYFGKES